MKRIILLVLVLVFISGCTLGEIRSKLPFMPSSTVTVRDGFIGGDKGIKSEIISPSKNGVAYLNQPLRVDVSVINEGESESEGTVCIWGLNRNYFTGFSGCECMDFSSLREVRMRDKEKLDGGKEVVTFDVGDIGEGESELNEFVVTARTRYEYKTFGLIKPCIKKDLYSEEGCDFSESKNILKSVSSAPLKITEVTHNKVSSTDSTLDLRVDIKMKNSGNGNVYELNRGMDSCEIDPDLKMKVDVSLLNSPASFTCNSAEIRKDSSDNLLGLGEDEGIASCTIRDIELADEGYEIDDLIVQLEYVYETITTNGFQVIE